MTKHAVDLAAFVQRFRQFQDEHKSSRVAEFQTAFANSARGFVELQARALERNRRTGEAFNIFHVLGVHEREVKTHSAFLADLLDPRGTHSQGDLFLRKFLATLSTCLSALGKPFPPVAHGPDVRWLVQEGKVAAPYGNLDIFLASASAVLVIENKINAGEGLEQLARYAQWLRRRARSGEATALIFLTLRGDRSVSCKAEDYFPLSYRSTISDWLRSCLDEIRAPRVRDILVQYLDTIALLCGDENGQI